MLRVNPLQLKKPKQTVFVVAPKKMDSSAISSQTNHRLLKKRLQKKLLTPMLP